MANPVPARHCKYDAANRDLFRAGYASIATRWAVAEGLPSYSVVSCGKAGLGHSERPSAGPSGQRRLFTQTLEIGGTSRSLSRSQIPASISIGGPGMLSKIEIGKRRNILFGESEEKAENHQRYRRQARQADTRRLPPAGEPTTPSQMLVHAVALHPSAIRRISRSVTIPIACAGRASTWYPSSTSKTVMAAPIVTAAAAAAGLSSRR